MAAAIACRRMNEGDVRADGRDEPDRLFGIARVGHPEKSPLVGGSSPSVVPESELVGAYEAQCARAKGRHVGKERPVLELRAGRRQLTVKGLGRGVG
jgi:hypothetical protein